MSDPFVVDFRLVASPADLAIAIGCSDSLVSRIVALNDVGGPKPKPRTLTEIELRLPSSDDNYSRSEPYHSIELSKKNRRTKGTRTVWVITDRELANTQKAILRRLGDFLAQKVSGWPGDCVHAYVRGRSIVTNAAVHVGARTLLKADIEDFFGTVTTARVAHALIEAGLTPAGADLLARLTTIRGRLPLGFNASPLLANLVCQRLGRRVARTVNGECNQCTCSGTGLNGPVTVNCTESTCGVDHRMYQCTAPETWQGPGDPCGEECTCSGTGINGPVTVNCDETTCGVDNYLYLCNGPQSWAATGQPCEGGSNLMGGGGDSSLMASGGGGEPGQLALVQGGCGQQSQPSGAERYIGQLPTLGTCGAVAGKGSSTLSSMSTMSLFSPSLTINCNAVTTTYVYDGANILQERTGSAVKTHLHGPGIDEPLATEDGSATRVYHHADRRGSLLATTSSSGATSATRTYDAFGNIVGGSTSSGYAYTGREWDPETGLYFYRARYYDPTLGRFISNDPSGFEGGLNLFEYALSNPVNLVDHTGKTAAAPALGWGGRVAAAAGGAAAAAGIGVAGTGAIIIGVGAGVTCLIAPDVCAGIANRVSDDASAAIAAALAACKRHPYREKPETCHENERASSYLHCAYTCNDGSSLVRLRLPPWLGVCPTDVYRTWSP